VKLIQSVASVGALKLLPRFAGPNLSAVSDADHGDLPLNSDGGFQLFRHEKTTRRVQLDATSVGEEKPLQPSLLGSSDSLRLEARHGVCEAALAEEVEAAINT
jgi:hypothetical protein